MEGTSWWATAQHLPWVCPSWNYYSGVIQCVGRVYIKSGFGFVTIMIPTFLGWAYMCVMYSLTLERSTLSKACKPSWQPHVRQLPYSLSHAYCQLEITTTHQKIRQTFLHFFLNVFRFLPELIFWFLVICAISPSHQFWQLKISNQNITTPLHPFSCSNGKLENLGKDMTDIMCNLLKFMYI